MSAKVQIIVRDYTLQALIGIYPEEHTKMQTICVNMTLDLELKDNFADEIIETLSYEQIVEQIESLAKIHHNLVETLAHTLNQFCLRDKRVKAVKTQVEKLEVFTKGRVGCIVSQKRN